jgi:hypothetical protein
MASRSTRVATCCTPVVPDGCAIFVVDVPAVTGRELHPEYTPCDWDSHQFNVEDRLDEELKNHPWRVLSRRSAKVALLTRHHFSRWCAASLAFAERGNCCDPKRDVLPICRRRLTEPGSPGRTVPRAALDTMPPPLGPAALEVCEGNSSAPKCAAPIGVRRDGKNKREIWARLAAHHREGATGTAPFIPSVLVHTLHHCVEPWAGWKAANPGPSADAFWAHGILQLRDSLPGKLSSVKESPHGVV